MRRGAALLSAALFLGLASTSHGAGGAVPLDDSPQGMTCHFYSKAARLSWQQKGGDWRDAAGSAYGDLSYVRDSVAKGDALQTFRLDVSPLARDWIAGKAPVGSIFLRNTGGGRAGIVNFASREHPDVAQRPKLTVSWDDGVRAEENAVADTHFSCPNHRSYGGEKVFKVGGGHNAVLVFPFKARAGRTLVSAHLQLSSDKQYGPQSSIGVFAPAPGGSAQPSTSGGLADGFPNDVGIASHPDVIFADRFEERGWQAFWSGIDARSAAEMISEDRGNGFEPLTGRALRVTLAKGVNTALNAHLRFAALRDGEPEEAYFRYYLRLGENWNPTIDGGKMPGFSGTYGRAGWGMRKSDGVNGWSTRGAFFQQTSSSGVAAALRGVGSYVYHADMEGLSGDTWGWSLGPSGLLQKNRWYSVEQRVRMNSLGKADGVLQAWIDGQLVFERKNLRFREVPDLKIESVWMNVYHGGVRPAPHDMSLYIDNLVVARKYIGPMKVAE